MLGFMISTSISLHGANSNFDLSNSFTSLDKITHVNAHSLQSTNTQFSIFLIIIHFNFAHSFMNGILISPDLICKVKAVSFAIII
ncbi:MAG: hypothetical protein WCG25_08000 [bacterium]